MHIEEVLAPVSVETFVADYLGSRYLRLGGVPRRFERLLPWPLLNDTLARLRVSGDRVRMVCDGRSVPSEEYLCHATSQAGSQLRSHAIHRMLSQGATLVVDAIDEVVPTIRTLAESFERVFRIHVGVNVYAGFRRQHGFDLHWDDHDTLILQVAGRKRWRVFEPTRLHPLRSDVTQAAAPARDATPVWEGLLTDGELLYMPRGWWHVATPVDEPSLHLTLGLCRPTGASLLDWIVTRLRTYPETRQDLPHLESTERQAAYLAGLGERIRALVAETTLEDYMAWHEARLAVRPAFSLPVLEAVSDAAVHEDTTVRLTSTRRLWLRPSRSGEVTFELSGQTWRCDPALRPALELLSAFPCLLAGVVAAVPPDAQCALKTLLGAMAMSGEIRYDVEARTEVPASLKGRRA